MDTQQRLRIPSLYLRRGKNSVQEMGKNVAKWVPQIWYHHPHHLGTDVTFFFPRPQHVKKTIHNTVRNIPSLHSDFFSHFVLWLMFLSALGVVVYRYVCC